MSVIFTWGEGGVGKSHVALKTAFDEGKKTLLITTDPSKRLVELVKPFHKKNDVYEIAGKNIHIKATDATKFFERLTAKAPANPTVNNLYMRMVKGLQEFRDYITLIHLSEELRKTTFDTIVIDTPPFQDAIGLHRAVFNLRQFFETSLVQLAVKTSKVSLIQVTAKRAFEATRLFIGKKASQDTFEFVLYLSKHVDLFTQGAKSLEKLFYSPETLHRFIITPETKVSFLDEINASFKSHRPLDFVINRSTKDFLVPEGNDPFLEEIRKLQRKEATLTSAIQKIWSHAVIQSIQLMLMGDDTADELLKYLGIEKENGPERQKAL